TPAERVAAAQTSEGAPGISQLMIFLAAIAAFVALAFRVILKFSSGFAGRETKRRLHMEPAAPVIRPRTPDAPRAEDTKSAEHMSAESNSSESMPARGRLASSESIEEMAEPTIARLREIAKRWETPTRVPRQPRLAAYELEPEYRADETLPRRHAMA